MVTELAPETFFEPKSAVGLAHLTRLFLGSLSATMGGLGVELPYILDPVEAVSRGLRVNRDDARDILVAWAYPPGLVWRGTGPTDPCFLTIEGCRRLRDQFDSCPHEHERDFIERLRVVVMLNESLGGRKNVG